MDCMTASLEELKSDSLLFARLREREPEAMIDVYGRYGPICYSVIIRIVGDHHASEDLVQETLLRVWTRTHLYEPGRGNLRSWIISIARNQAIDHLRSARRGVPLCNGFGSGSLAQLSSAGAKHSWHSYKTASLRRGPPFISSRRIRRKHFNSLTSTGCRRPKWRKR